MTNRQRVRRILIAICVYNIIIVPIWYAAPFGLLGTACLVLWLNIPAIVLGPLWAMLWDILRWGVFVDDTHHASRLWTFHFWHRWASYWGRVPKGLCGHCRYDLRGNISGICPECGVRVAEPEAHAD